MTSQVVATATHIGTATVLLQLGELCLLTDPALDPVGADQAFAVPGTDLVLPLQRTRDPVLPVGGLPHLDAVLLSHDQHADNFDISGRAVAASAEAVLTTESGAGRLGGAAVGLAPWQSVELQRGATRARVTATPARHGPAESLALVGEVIGFVIEVEGLPRTIYVSGDTVDFPDLDEIGRRFDLGPAMLHIGRARFAPTGETAYTMSGHEAAALARRLGARGVLPMHWDDWAHFSESAQDAASALTAAGCSVHRMVSGEPYDLWAGGLMESGPR